MTTSLASLSEGTIKQYARPIRLWWLYCARKGHNWFQPDIGVVLDFLATEMKNMSTYGSLNSMRSALSLITNVELGSDPRVKRFCKGVSILKPSKPKYALTWDPDPIVAYLKTLTPHSSLDIKILTRKLATLMTLATASRVQNLALIKRANIILTNPVIIRYLIGLRHQALIVRNPQWFFMFSKNARPYALPPCCAFISRKQNCLFRATPTLSL